MIGAEQDLAAGSIQKLAVIQQGLRLREDFYGAGSSSNYFELPGGFKAGKDANSPQ